MHCSKIRDSTVYELFEFYKPRWGGVVVVQGGQERKFVLIFVCLLVYKDICTFFFFFFCQIYVAKRPSVLYFAFFF